MARRPKDFLYWAVVDHLRTWLYFDGIELHRVGPAGEGFDEQAVRRIACEYKVIRGLLRSKGGDGKYQRSEEDKGARWYVRRLRKDAQSWPVDLVERADRCRRIAAAAEKCGHTNGQAVSMVTKLMWFLRPDGWTVFDSLAATGLGIPMKVSAKLMPEFYRRLSDGGFIPLARAIGKELPRGSYGRPFGERVIDKYLMLNGAGDDWRQETLQKCESFLAVAPRATAQEIDEVARRICHEFRVDAGLLKDGGR